MHDPLEPHVPKSKVDIWKFIAIINMIGMLLIVLIFVFAMKDGNSCLTNPLIYGAKKLTTGGPQGTGGVFCQCNFKNGIYEPFVFDQQNLSVLKDNRVVQGRGEGFPVFNITLKE